MPLAFPPQWPKTDSWWAFGHSYFKYSAGTFDQTGRFDARVRAMMDIEHTNWYNFAIDGAQLTVQGPSQGGFARLYREKNYGVNKTATTGYSGDGGGTLLCWGINDLGNGAGANAAASVVRVAFTNALRAMISRCRMSVLYENSFQVGTRTTYGAAFSNTTGLDDYTSNGDVHLATSTTNATVTLTLPSDYGGETVAIAWVVNPGSSGGVATLSGTAGVTGTIDWRNIMPNFLSHGAYVYRITNLTAANAGQTIVMTVTTISGDVGFDCWWLESKQPPPVIVVNVARLPDAGYTIYPSWAGTNAQKDQDVLDLNRDIASVVAEFGSMVQLADIESVLQKNSALFGDSIHPNDIGAAKCADAVIAAINRLRPEGGDGQAAYFNPPSRRTGAQLQPRRTGAQWYTSDFAGTATAATLAAQEAWAIPFVVTQPRDSYTNMGLAVVTGGTVAGTYQLGVYDDPQGLGYPQCLVLNPTSGGALSLGTTSNVIVATSSFTWKPDPGLFWLYVKCITTGTSQTTSRAAGPLPYIPRFNQTTGIFTAFAGWRLTSQGTGVPSGTFPTGATATTVAPPVYMKLA